MRSSSLTYHSDALILESNALCGFLWWWGYLYLTPLLCGGDKERCWGHIIKIFMALRSGGPYGSCFAVLMKTSRVYDYHWILSPSRVFFLMMLMCDFLFRERIVHLQKSIRTWNSIPRYITNKCLYISTVSLCTKMFMVALFAIASYWKLSKFPLRAEMVNKLWYIHTVHYYIAVRMNDL